MINLIPKEEKKKMKWDFYSRLGVLFLVTLAFCIFIAILSLLPSYFMVSVKGNVAETKLETQKEKIISGEEVLTEAKAVNDQLVLLEKAEKNQFLLSVKVINAIVLKKRSDIKITRILYENNETAGKKISINGTAPSREVLLLFSKALRDDPTFKSVDLPVSNFVKGSNIQFFLTLIPA